MIFKSATESRNFLNLLQKKMDKIEINCRLIEKVLQTLQKEKRKTCLKLALDLKKSATYLQS